MATYTSHYNLTKPEGTERVNIGIINQNMDSIDAQMYKNAQSIIANHGGMAIPSNNNTHAAVSSGQYVYVYNHSSLSEGLYIAKSAISTNGALSLSNLTAVSNGGLNHVYSTLNSNIGGYLPSKWTGNITNISQLDSLTVPGKYLKYINSGVIGSTGGWAVVEVAALDGYANYFQIVTFPEGSMFARNHPTDGEWSSFSSLTNNSITKNDLIVKRFVSPAGGQTTSIVTNGIDAFFIYAIYRTNGSDQGAEGTALIKIYNSTAILTRKVGMEGFGVSYSNGTLSVTIPGYCSGGIIACAT